MGRDSAGGTRGLCAVSPASLSRRLQSTRAGAKIPDPLTAQLWGRYGITSLGADFFQQLADRVAVRIEYFLVCI